MKKKGNLIFMFVCLSYDVLPHQGGETGWSMGQHLIKGHIKYVLHYFSLNFIKLNFISICK